tara:strand:- start:79 stop:186 length:108 start_codon:yes stop_codon:yes gene_type:complete
MKKYKNIKILIIIFLAALIIYSCGENGTNTQSFGY